MYKNYVGMNVHPMHFTLDVLEAIIDEAKEGGADGDARVHLGTSDPNTPPDLIHFCITWAS